MILLKKEMVFVGNLGRYREGPNLLNCTEYILKIEDIPNCDEIIYSSWGSLNCKLMIRLKRCQCARVSDLEKEIEYGYLKPFNGDLEMMRILYEL